MDLIYSLTDFAREYRVASVLIPLAGVGFFLLLRWLAPMPKTPEAPVADPAHLGCPTFQSTLFTVEEEFIPVTIIVHNREEDKHPYLIVQADDVEDVRVPFDSFVRLNITDNTKDYKRPFTGFGIDYRDFAGDALLLFVVPGTSHEPTAKLMETIRGSYDRWAANLGKGTLEVNDQSYQKPKKTLVRRSA